MAPNSSDVNDQDFNETKPEKVVGPQAAPRKYHYLYLNIIYFTYGYLAALYGLYLCFTSAKIYTIIFTLVLNNAAILGIMCGAHRLWSHKSFKARLPLEILLMVFNTLAFQNTAADWVRNHRLHHKCCDTDGDPHNAARGFFFSHLGWLLVKKHDDVKIKGKSLDLSDIESNPVLQFQKKYALPWVTLVTFVFPTVTPMYFWGESLNNSWHVATMLRYLTTLNITFLVNSGAHRWGYRPYDKNILPSQNIPLTVLTLGEGFHNFHHVFPWDYRGAELGNKALNFTTFFINACAWLGLAYDLKTVSPQTINLRKKRTGDGTNLWGWDDKDMPSELKEATEILHHKDE